MARTRGLVAIGIAALAVLSVVGVAPAQASVSQGAPTPSPEPFEPGRPVPALPDTSVGTSPAGFSGTGSAVVSGSKQAGNGVIVTVDGSTVCTVEADAREDWSCGSVPLPHGAGLEIVATESAPTGEPVPAPGGATIDALGPPTLDGTGSFVTTGLISGIGRPGALVAVSIDGRVDPRCAASPVETSGYWACSVSAPSGRYFIRAQQSDAAIGSGRSSAYSNVQDVLIDRDAPAPASITSPASGSRHTEGGLIVTGSGEDAASIDVYIDNVPACSAIVSGTSWSCTVARVQRGAHSLQAVQRDVAGNYASPGAVITVSFAAPHVASPKPRPTPSVPAVPPAPAPAAPVPAPDGSTPAPSPETTPIFPRSDGSAPTLREALTNWSVPTGFGSGLGAVASTVSRNWYTAPLVGLLFVGLVALPLRMVVTALRGRVHRPRARVTGRNHVRPFQPQDGAPGPRPWLTGILPLAATAGLIALSVGVGGEVRYLRLVLSIALGLALLNLLGGVLAVRLGARWAEVPARLRFMPLMLLAAAVTAVLSRWTALEPPVITGMLVGAGFALGVPARRRAVTSLIQVGAVTGLGVVGWLAYGLVGRSSATSFAGAVAGETLATVCLAGLGSALVLMLPVASLPGRAVIEWSRPVWTGAMLTVSTIVALVVAGDGPAPLAIVPWAVGAIVFASLSVAVWAFVRFLEPQARA